MAKRRGKRLMGWDIPSNGNIRLDKNPTSIRTEILRATA